MKILGILMIVVGAVLVPILLLSFISFILRFNAQTNDDSSFMAGYLIGGILTIVFFSWLDYLLFKFGIRFYKRKPNQDTMQDQIENIGE